jgi:carbonic anhydrase
MGVYDSSDIAKSSSKNKTVPGTWAFDREDLWDDVGHDQCKNSSNRKSPLNIDTNNVSMCSVFCRLSVNYKPTSCNVSMVNNIPTVTFSPTCTIKFNNDFFFLRKMTIHYTSMHTVNDGYSDLEIMLYHNRSVLNDNDGGVIISILLSSGSDYGSANEFMNEFINKLPANEQPVESDVAVSDTWCPDQLFPKSSKTFYYYDGALPYPPCSQNWTFIIFEENISISQNIIDTIKIILGDNTKNIRPIQKKPSDVVIFYNSNTQFDGVQDISDTAIESAISPLATESVLTNSSETWLKRNIYAIKGILIAIILVLMIYVAIKFAKVIVQNDLLNSFILRQLQKKQHSQYVEQQQAAAAAQAAEYGETAPIENVNVNNNNNNTKTK